MCAATLRAPYMGILAILLIGLTVRLADAEYVHSGLIGYDCANATQIMGVISLLDIDESDLNSDMKNILPILLTQPDELAFRYMNGPGYMAVKAGEVFYIIQCVPVKVKFNHVDECYNRLPVLRDGQSVFLTPRTHIITNSAAKISCQSPLREHYKVVGVWFQFTPRPLETKTPKKFDPSIKLEWSGLNLASLPIKGIYTQDESNLSVDSMREQIMFPLEQTVIAETVAQQFTKGMRGSPSIMNAFSDEMIDQMAEIIWSRTWGKFINFSPAWLTLIVVFVCYYTIIKTVADTILNGFQLYNVFGFSIQLFAACWNSLTRILLNKEKEKNK